MQLTLPQTIKVVDHVITTASVFTTMYGTVQPRRLMHGGWISLSYYDSGRAMYASTWSRFLQREFESIGLLGDVNAYCEYLQYGFPAGAVVRVTLEY